MAEKPVTVSVPSELLDAVEVARAAYGESRSAFFRRALGVLLELHAAEQPVLRRSGVASHPNGRRHRHVRPERPLAADPAELTRRRASLGRRCRKAEDEHRISG